MKRKTSNYNLKNGNTIVYKGTSKDLNEREKAHKSSGKKFTTIQKVGNTKTDEGALKEETRQLEAYRKKHKGKNPKYNKAKNG